MSRRITEYDLEVIRAMHGQGCHDLEIVRRLGISRTAIQVNRRRMGLATLKHVRPNSILGLSNVYPGADIDSRGDAAEFGAAMSRWKAHHPHQQPGPREVLQVARSLGYRKVAT